MRLAAILALCLASICGGAVILFAALQSPYWAIGCGSAFPLFLFIAAREADAARANEEWKQSRRHPRL